jgi:hypothetical protein
MKSTKFVVAVLLSIAAGITSGQMNVSLYVSGNSGDKSTEGSITVLSVSGQNATGPVSDSAYKAWTGLLAPLAFIATDAGYHARGVTQLFQNYPNPFRGKTTIPFEIVRQERITLTVLNVLGQPVKILIDEQMPPGRHRVEFDAVSISPGIFFYTLRFGEYRLTRNMVLTK